MSDRCRILRWGAAVFGLAAGMSGAPVATPEYIREIEAWRSARVTQLVKPDGWLSLVGLHFLQAGENSIGAAPDNAVILPKGPAHLGVLIMADDGLVRAVFNPGVDVQIDGEDQLAADLKDDSHGASTVVATGTVSFMIIDRGGKKAVRIKDSDADARTKFIGLSYFPIDPEWRIEADWVAFEKPREVPVSDILGNTSPALILGKAVFKRDGHTIELLPIQDHPDGVMFFVISDATSGHETYGAARFVYASPAENGKVILDFNKAQNPPCAFTGFATCPLPPKENRLRIAITAGEKKYRDETKPGH